MSQLGATHHSPASSHVAWRRRAWWPWVRRGLTLVFFASVLALLVSQGRTIEWREVIDVLRDYPLRRLLEAAGFALLGHAVYATYDLLGRAWTRHKVPLRTVIAITFVSYAFNLNLGTWVGGFAFRYRLYSRFGLAPDAITRIVGLSIATNWLGYLLLGGVLFVSGEVTPPPDWPIGATALRLLGVALIAGALAYLIVCATARRREWTVRGHHVSLPPGRLALAQVAVSCLHWLSVGAVLYWLLQARQPYLIVLGTLLVAAVAGVIAHIPAGLGVLEAVFIALLGTRVAQGELLAVLLAYRALYYLGPMLVASVVFLLLETHAKQDKKRRVERERALGTPIAERRHPH